ncbi:MAG TPA: 50S ribosomal protein L1 [bacterium]|jgi:large subunit ribosomal protein L1|nr:50S ribosomal protein L1 [bacterium]HNT65326.1 50S ribosomal protein L1 [bacterium]HOX86494.1 50S ribosomal protein L1 [bacterium]HPG46520.1 50S ribosomal protein L1 [bacterium]HPM98424.1 50S ribosomal protein L1 [bacterium]
MKHSKRYIEAAKKVKGRSLYSLDEGLNILAETATAKFDESIDVAIRLGVDPRKADQMVRGTVILPKGTGKVTRVVVLANGSKEEEAKSAGADEVGFAEVIEKIQGGWVDFDVLIATPDVMGQLGKLGKILGPRGLMPNAKSGTVTFEVGQAVRDAKSGKIAFRVDRNGIVHAAVGKKSFSVPDLKENVVSFIDTVNRLKPASAKGVYVKSITLSSTMGPGIRIDKNQMSEAE